MENYKEVVQSKVVEYLHTGNMEVAGEAFSLMKEHDWKRKAGGTAQKLRGTRDDAYSLYAQKFMDALSKYNPERGEFVNFVNFAIKRATINEGVKRGKILAVEVGPSKSAQDDNDGDEMVMIENHELNEFLAEQPDVHELAFDLKPKERERILREIVGDIVSKATPEEVEILIHYSQSNSMRKTADEFGTNQVRIMRTIDRMKKYYDSDRYGDVAQYFSTPTTKTRGGGRK